MKPVPLIDAYNDGHSIVAFVGDIPGVNGYINDHKFISQHVTVCDPSTITFCRVLYLLFDEPNFILVQPVTEHGHHSKDYAIKVQKGVTVYV